MRDDCGQSAVEVQMATVIGLGNNHGLEDDAYILLG